MHLIEQHPAVCGILAFLTFNAAVAAMEPPTKRGFYRWLYRFLNMLLQNVEQAARSRFPELPVPAQGAEIDAHIDIPAAQTAGEINAGDTGKGNTPSL